MWQKGFWDFVNSKHDCNFCSDYTVQEHFSSSWVGQVPIWWKLKPQLWMDAFTIMLLQILHRWALPRLHFQRLHQKLSEVLTTYFHEKTIPNSKFFKFASIRIPQKSKQIWLIWLVKNSRFDWVFVKSCGYQLNSQSAHWNPKR